MITLTLDELSALLSAGLLAMASAWGFSIIVEMIFKTR